MCMCMCMYVCVCVCGQTYNQVVANLQLWVTNSQTLHATHEGCPGRQLMGFTCTQETRNRETEREKVCTYMRRNI